MAGAILILSFPKYFWLYLIAIVIMNAMIAIFNTMFITIIQINGDSNYIGWVFGVIVMFSNSLMTLEMLVSEQLADIVAIEYIMITCNCSMFDFIFSSS